MIKFPALMMGAAMTAIAGGTYVVLDRLPEGLLPPPIGRAMAAEEPPGAEPAPVTITAVAPVATPAAPAAEPAEPEAAAEAAPAEPEEAPATTPGAPPAPAPAAAEPPAETAKAESAIATPPSSRTAPEADVLKPWWPDPASMPANQLKLQYAGQVQGQGAIALLFSAPLQLETLQQHATVRAAGGEPVAGTWTLGKNPKLAVLAGLAPGRYTVVLQPQIADQKGFMLGATLTGPVYVKEP